MPRKGRDSKVELKALLKPIDVTKFGSDDDPCFGKLYDLNEDTCLMCGDHEICAIVFAKKAIPKRLDWEKKNPSMDMRIDKGELNRDIKRWVKDKREQGINGLRLKVKLRNRFRLTDEALAKYL